MKSIWVLLSLIATFSSCALVKVNDSDSCVINPAHYAEASSQLHELAVADQADRAGDINKIDWGQVTPRDIERRIQVAKIFAEGCFKEAKDYANAALIYQHGDAPDHFYQTFIWSKKAVELGDDKQKWLMAAGLDRYLVHSGHKELFGTQGAKDAGSLCWCVEPIEASFPKAKRLEYMGKTLEEGMAILQSFNASQLAACPQMKTCNHSLHDSPAGTVVGFW